MDVLCCVHTWLLSCAQALTNLADTLVNAAEVHADAGDRITAQVCCFGVYVVVMGLYLSTGLVLAAAVEGL